MAAFAPEPNQRADSIETETISTGSLKGDMPVVAHSMRKFLPMSQNWIYPQITQLRRYRSIVVTNQTMNLECFPLAPDSLRVIPRRHRDWAERVSRLLGLGRDTRAYWRRALESSRPQVVHSHFGNRGYFDLHIVRRMRIPQVVTFYGHDISRLPHHPVWKPRLAELFQSASLFTVEGSRMRASLAALGCPESRIRIRRHGVDLENFRWIPRTIGDDGVVRILIGARFVEKKGVPIAVRAVARIAGRHPVRLTVIGNANENDPHGQAIKREVLSLLQSSPLDSRSEWKGSVTHEEFMRIAAEHHIYIQASQYSTDGDSEGGAPVALIQLAATGMPILATTHCDIPDMVIDGVTGALAPERDLDALAAGLERLVRAPEKWEEMGRQARRHMEAEFDMSRCIADLEAIYDEAVRSGPT